MFFQKIITAAFVLMLCQTVIAQIPGIEWVRPIFGAAPNTPLAAVVTDMCTDRLGNTYLTGEFRGELKFGTITLTGTGNDATLFLAKYNKAGIPIWATKAAPNIPTSASAFNNSAKIDVDSLGGVYWCANYEATSIDFGNGVTINRSCTNDCREGFLVKLNSDGVVQFKKALKASTGQDFYVAGVVADAQGRHYLTGSFTGTEVWLQGGANIGGITKDGFYLVQYNVAGGAEWIAFLPDNTGTPAAQSIAISPDGNSIAVAGSYDAPSLDFGNSASTTSTAVEKRFTVWYNTMGQPMGAGTLGATEIDLFDILVDKDYKLWAVCNFTGDLSWKNATVTSTAGANKAAAVVALLPGTDAQLISIVGFNGNAAPLNTIALSTNGKFYTGGTASENLQTGAVTLTNQGCSDIILSGGSSTTTEWAKDIGGAGCEAIENFDSGTLIDTDSDGNIYICGHFKNGATAGGSTINGNGLWVGKWSNSPVDVVDNPLTDNALLVFPNPASGVVQIASHGVSAGFIKIYDGYGKLITASPIAGESTAADVSGWHPGIYFATVVNEKGAVMQSAKLVVE